MKGNASALPTRLYQRRSVQDNYRAQWPYEATPDGFFDQFWVYAFTLPNSASASYPIGNFPLRLDDDADFYCRGLWALDEGETGINGSALLVIMRDVYGRRLADDYQPLYSLFAPVSVAATIYYYGYGRNVVPLGTFNTPASLEPELYCPAGSIITLDLAMPPDATPGDTAATIWLAGVKRYRGCRQ